MDALKPAIEKNSKIQAFGSSKINLTARIPKTEMYSSIYY